MVRQIRGDRKLIVSVAKRNGWGADSHPGYRAIQAGADDPGTDKHAVSNDNRNRLLALLSTGRLTSGTALGERLNMSRSAVHKHVQALMRQGVPIHRVPGRGYRLSHDVHLLDSSCIRRGLHADIAQRITQVTVLQQVDSTNNWLLHRQEQSGIHGHVCAAEAQTRGRGRRGHGWVATPYRNVMFSVGWEFSTWPESVTGLGLAASVAVVRGLRGLSICDVGIKWPNDLMVGGAKLGGILIDVHGESAGECVAVIGIGINVRIEGADAAAIDQPYTDLSTVMGEAIDRNQLIAACGTEIVRMLDRFGEIGFNAFKEEWERLHAYSGCRVTALGHGSEIRGRVAGASETGALLIIDDHGRTHRFMSGDVRLLLDR